MPLAGLASAGPYPLHPACRLAGISRWSGDSGPTGTENTQAEPIILAAYNPVDLHRTRSQDPTVHALRAYAVNCSCRSSQGTPQSTRLAFASSWLASACSHAGQGSGSARGRGQARGACPRAAGSVAFAVALAL